jgi:polysaccharide biosynthesis protein PelC
VRKLWLAIVVLAISACATQFNGQSPKLDRHKTVYIMPLENQSNMPMAQAQAEQLIASVLAESGLKVKLYPKQNINDLQASLEPQLRLNQATTWLSSQASGYVITGSVQEWQYKYGLDGEPAIGITLTLNTTEGNALWRGSVSKSGWGRESLPHIALKALENLLDALNWE